MKRWLSSHKPALTPGAADYGLSRYGTYGTGHPARSSRPGPVRYQRADTLLEYGVVDADTGAITRRPLTRGLVAWINPGGAAEILALWDGHRWTFHRQAETFGGAHLSYCTAGDAVLREVVYDPSGVAPAPEAQLVSPLHFVRLEAKP